MIIMPLFNLRIAKLLLAFLTLATCLRSAQKLRNGVKPLEYILQGRKMLRVKDFQSSRTYSSTTGTTHSVHLRSTKDSQLKPVLVDDHLDSSIEENTSDDANLALMGEAKQMPNHRPTIPSQSQNSDATFLPRRSLRQSLRSSSTNKARSSRKLAAPQDYYNQPPSSPSTDYYYSSPYPDYNSPPISSPEPSPPPPAGEGTILPSGTTTSPSAVTTPSEPSPSPISTPKPSPAPATAPTPSHAHPAHPPNPQPISKPPKSAVSNSTNSTGLGAYSSSYANNSGNYTTNSNDGGVNVGAIVGAAVGGAALLLLLTALVMAHRRSAYHHPTYSQVSNLARPPREFVPPAMLRNKYHKYVDFWQHGSKWEPFLKPDPHSPHGFSAYQSNRVDSTSPAVYEFGLVHPARRDVPPVVVYVGKAGGKSGLKERHDRYRRDGSNIQDLLRLSLGVHGCILMRRYKYVAPRGSGGEGGVADDHAETMETNFLSLFNYAYNKEQNGEKRGIFLTPKKFLMCFPAGVFIQYDHHHGKKAFQEVDPRFPQTLPKPTRCNEGC